MLRKATERQIAIDNSLNINEVIDVALDMVIETYEKKYGPITASESRISAADIIPVEKKVGKSFSYRKLCLYLHKKEQTCRQL